MDLQVQVSLGEKVSALIRKLSSAGAASQTIILDARQLTRSFAAIAGITKADFKQKGASVVEGTVVIRKIDDLLRTNGRTFIKWDQTENGGNARIQIDRTNGPELVTQISQDVADYLSTLMAPLATGELLTKVEYLELVNSVYGKEITREIAAARFKMKITLPQTVQSISGGVRAGQTASFDTPLLDLLVLETPLVYEITWGK